MFYNVRQTKGFCGFCVFFCAFPTVLRLIKRLLLSPQSHHELHPATAQNKFHYGRQIQTETN